MPPLSRRAFLLSSGLSAALLPLMPENARGQAATPKRRFIVMAVPNGWTKLWYPSAGAGISLRPGTRLKGAKVATGQVGDNVPLAPLASLKDKVLVLGNVVVEPHLYADGIPQDAAQVNGKPIQGHAVSPLLLTGEHPVPGGSQPDGWKVTAGGESIDVYLGKHMPGASGLKFRNLALRPTQHRGGGKISYEKLTNGTSAVGVDDNPPNLFAKMFTGGDLGAEEVDRVIAGEKHILDRVSGHLSAMRNHFGAENMARIDAHLAAVAETSRRISIINTCNKPKAPPTGVDWTNDQYNPDFPLITKSQLDLAVTAIACDMTRSISIYMGDYANGELAFPWLQPRNGAFGARLSHHTVAHDDANGDKGLKDYVDQWFVEQYAYLLQQLQATKDADGRPLLDSTVVLLCNLQNTGSGHRSAELGWILGGNFDGAFKLGRYLPWTSGKDGVQAKSNALYTALINASGAPQVDYFGDTFGKGKQELSDLFG